jgi:hypothetical protein
MRFNLSRKRLGVAALLLGLATAAPAGATDSLLSWQDLSSLKIWHAYSASDGRSYFEEMVLPASTKPSGGKPAQLYFSANPETVVIARSAGQSMIDWHYAGEFRHLIVVLQGDMVFDTGDGKIWHFKPGEAIYAEDWTGKGHRSGCGSPEGSSCVVIDMLIDRNPHEMPLRAPPKP